MPAVVSLKDIVDALDYVSDDVLYFVNRETGEVVSVLREVIGHAEDGGTAEDLLDWQADEFELAERILESNDYVRLPTAWDIHEWDMMRQFSESIANDDARDELLSALHGRRAFRRFKDTLRRLRLDDSWYRYREQALREIAIEWCVDHDVPYQA